MFSSQLAKILSNLEISPNFRSVKITNLQKILLYCYWSRYFLPLWIGKSSHYEIYKYLMIMISVYQKSFHWLIPSFWMTKSLPSHNDKKIMKNRLVHETFHGAAECLNRSHRAAWRGVWFCSDLRPRCAPRCSGYVWPGQQTSTWASFWRGTKNFKVPIVQTVSQWVNQKWMVYYKDV